MQRLAACVATPLKVKHPHHKLELKAPGPNHYSIYIWDKGSNSVGQCFGEYMIGKYLDAWGP